MDDNMAAHAGDPAGPLSAVTVVAATAEHTDRRKQRILEYIEESLAKSDATQANIGAINGDLMLVAYRIQQAVLESMPPGPAAPGGRRAVAADAGFRSQNCEADRTVLETESQARRRRIESLPNVTAARLRWIQIERRFSLLLPN